jgi:hypothetical protein
MDVPGTITAARRFSTRKRQLAVVTVALLAAAAAVAVPLAGSAQAQPTSVEVPRHDSPTITLSLAGASADALLVSRQATIGDAATYFSGANGSELADRGAMFPSSGADSSTLLGVVGHTLGWAEYLSQTSTSPAKYILHRTNLYNGSSVQQDVPTPPVAYTGDGWLSYSKGTAGGGAGDLLRNLFDGPTTTLIKDVVRPERLVADANGAVLTSYLPVTGQSTRYRLDLITYGATPTVERIADVTDEITSADLSATTVAWSTRPLSAPTPNTYHQRPRAGGSTDTYTDSSPWLHEAGVQAGDGQVAYVVSDPDHPAMRIVTGSTAQTVDLPNVTGSTVHTTPDWTAKAVGNRYYVGVSGPVSVAGVYSVEGDTLSKVATVPAPQIAVNAIAFSAGRLYYADDGAIDKPGMAVWQRVVTGATTPTLGTESLLPNRAYRLEDAGEESLSYSAGRGSTAAPAGGPPWRYQILDRGKITGTAPFTPYAPEEEQARYHSNTSGPYTLAEGKIYDPTGKLLYTSPSDGDFMFNNDDIYGSTMIWSDANSKKKTSTIWVRDIAKPKSSTNPRKLATNKCHTELCPQLVSIWGNRVAWTSDDTHIVTQTIGATTSRKIAATRTVEQLELGEGVLAWQINQDNSTRLLDLSSTKSTPYIVAGKANRIALDGHYFARTLTDQNRLLVYRVPFTAKQLPRLIGTYAPTGFTPNHDGKADTWAPQFDASKPLTGVTLKITATKSGKVFRTLKGTAPDGSIRDLSWDGLTSGGKALPVGTYNWTLTGAAADGDGDLISPGGKTVITGTVKITAT